MTAVNDNSGDNETLDRPARGEPGQAVLYLRVSTQRQLTTDYDPEGNSIPTQREWTRAKADELSAAVAEEYVEPGRSATSIDKRPAFQRMMAELRQRPHVRYVIVYMMSRAFRNALEELATKAELAKLGITLVSAKENFGEGYLGDAMQGIMAILNELQSRSNGADVKAKMANKAKNGGTLGQAPLGYLNIRELVDGREVRTVALDPERAPLIRLAFELYATGDYTLADLTDELYDRGLRTKRRTDCPGQAVSISRLSTLLRDRYYLGYVTYQGEEIPGRHEPLVEEDLFEQVQDTIESRAAAQEKRRVHHHYLKGTVFCGQCKQAGVTQRLIIQHTVNRHGTPYTYFFCRGKQTGTCQMPHINIMHLEDVVERHYATIGFRPDFSSAVRAHLAAVIDEENKAARLLHQQLAKELKELNAKEDNLLELAADGSLPQARIKTKLRDIEHQRQRLTTRLEQTSQDLNASARLIETCLTLLENPYGLYQRCDEEQRRRLNQALLHGLYIDDTTNTPPAASSTTPADSGPPSGLRMEHELTEPFGQLHAAQHQWAHGSTTLRQSHGRDDDKPDPGARDTQPHNANEALPQQGEGLISSNSSDGVSVLLTGIGKGAGCTTPRRVGDTGFEPVTSTVSR